jgi:hypothetical protein
MSCSAGNSAFDSLWQTVGVGVVNKMTIDNWLTIAVVVTTAALVVTNLIVTRFEIAKIRMNRPKPTPTPEPSQPKSQIQRIGNRLLRFLQSPWQFPPFLILINLFSLVTELRSNTPITRWAIYQISAAMAGIFYGFALILLNVAWEAIRGQWETNKKFVDLVEILSKNLDTTAETLALAQKAQQLPRSRSRKLSEEDCASCGPACSENDRCLCRGNPRMVVLFLSYAPATLADLSALCGQ